MDCSQSSARLRQPCEGALHTPSSRQNLEAFSGIGSFHGPDGPAPDADQRLAQFRSGITFIGKDVAQLRGLAMEPGKDTGRPIAGLNIGRMNAQCDQATRRPQVSVMMWRLRPLIFLPASKPERDVFSVVLTLSMNTPCGRTASALCVAYHGHRRPVDLMQLSRQRWK